MKNGKLKMVNDKRQMTNEQSQHRVVIVHDWLVGGGAEKVVLELHKMFPNAPIYTSFATEEWRKKLDNKVITGYLQHLGFARKFLPLLRMWWFRGLDLSDYDLIISSSGNGEAKHVRTQSRNRSWLTKWRVAHGANENRKGGVHISTTTANRSSQQSDTRQNSSGLAGSAGEQVSVVRKPVHICYCHTPPHYIWRQYDNYMQRPGFGTFNPIARLGLKLLVKPLRKADYKSAQRVDYFVANSTHIQKDIKKFYGRDSVVIHPPVDTERFTKHRQSASKRHGFITVGRLVPHKRVDIIVDACTQLGLPLKVVGSGPELSNLQKRAGPTVQFISGASDEVVAKELGKAKAFLFASEEDFGITPVEAIAAGTPVIAYKAGGALDYVVPGKTGYFFNQQNTKSLVESLKTYDKKLFVVPPINYGFDKHSLLKLIEEL